MGRPGSRSRAPMECDLFCVNNMPFFPFLFFSLRKPKNIYIVKAEKYTPAVFGTPTFFHCWPIPFFFFTTPSAQCLTFHEEKFVHHILEGGAFKHGTQKMGEA